MFKQFIEEDEESLVVEVPRPWYAVVKAKDVIYGLLIASIVVVGGHAWYHQAQQISLLQQQTEYLHRFLETLHFAGPQ